MSGLGEWFEGIKDLIEGGGDIIDWSVELLTGDDDNDVKNEITGWIKSETLTSTQQTSLLNFSKAFMQDFAKGSALVPKYRRGENKGKIIPPVAIAIGPKGPYFLTKIRNANTDNAMFWKGVKWAEEKYNVGMHSSAVARPETVVIKES